MASAAPAAAAKVNIVYYSMYGHVKALVDAAATGLRAAGVEVKVFRAAETLPDSVLEKMGAKDLPHNKDVPVVDETWSDADGFLFASGTRFGGITSQLKAFFDSTGGLWAKGALVGKPAGFLTSTGTQCGGQETTTMTALTNLVHHGMIFVSHGYTFPKLQFSNEKAHGVSPWSVSTLAGADGSLKPLAEELEAAEAYGKRFGGVAIALKAGAAAATAAATAGAGTA